MDFPTIRRKSTLICAVSRSFAFNFFILGLSSLEDSIAEQQRRANLNEILNADISASGATLNSAATKDRILSFRNKAPAADEAHLNNHKVLYSTGKPKAPTATKTRQVALNTY